MKTKLTAFIGIVLMLAMTLALVGCNKKTAETTTVTAAAPTVVSQQVEQVTGAQPATQAQQNTQQNTQKATQKAAQKTTKKVAQKTTQKATQKATEATGSPVQRFQGRYGSGRCTIDVTGVANNTVEIHVYWSSSAFEHSEWVMSGNFDEDGTYVYYSDCVKTNYTYGDDGELVSKETVYRGGKGSLIFKGNTMTWEDQAEHIADGMTFTK